MAASDEKESRLVRFLDVFGNVFTLNVVYVIFSLPIITIGASTAALYSVALKMVKKEEGPIFKSFLKAFKSNLKKATAAWVLVLLAFAVIYAEYLLVFTTEGSIASFYSIILIIELVFFVLALPFLFPLLAHYDNTLWNTFKNAFLLSVSNMGSWLKIALAWFAPIFLTLWYPKLFMLTWYLWLFLIFGLIGYGTSHTVNKVFKRIENVQGQKTQIKGGNAAEKKTEHLDHSKTVKDDQKSSDKAKDAD